MARPRTVSDEVILDAALVVMQRGGGPEALTFAAAAKAVGLSPAALVQRFGTRPQLLRAALLRLWDALDARTEAADAEASETPEGAISMLVALSTRSVEIDDYVEGLSLLREDLRDPQLRARGAAWGRVLAEALGRRLTDDPARQGMLGRLMASQWQGAQIWWAFSRDADPEQAIEAELRVWCAAVLKG